MLTIARFCTKTKTVIDDNEFGAHILMPSRHWYCS